MRSLRSFLGLILLGFVSLVAVLLIGFGTERAQPQKAVQSFLFNQEERVKDVVEQQLGSKSVDTTSSVKSSHKKVSAFTSTPWLHVDGTDIKDPQGNKVVLRGVSLPDLALNDYRRGADLSAPQIIDMLTDKRKGWYATVIRLAVYPVEKFGYNVNPKRYYSKYIKPAVDKCVEKQVYCIIDWHYIDDPRKFNSETRAFWTDIAPKFKNYPNIIFEVFNENSTKMSWGEWKSIVQPWVNLIRQYAPKNLILVGAPNWSQRLHDAPGNPILGQNIVYVAHIYPALDRSLWDPWIFNTANRIPIFVTEWGFRKDADEITSGTIASFGNPLKQKLEKYNLSWTCWVADHTWYPEMFDKKWNLLVGENYMGGFAKDYLYEKRNQKIIKTSLSKNSFTD